jgi:hypothetical protein
MKQRKLKRQHNKALNQGYPDQRIMVIAFNNYAYLILRMKKSCF